MAERTRKNEQLQRQRGRVARGLQAMEDELDARAPDAARLEILQQKLTKLTEELEQLKSSNRIFYNVVDQPGREVYLVELFPGDVLVAKKGERAPPQRFTGRAAEADFRRWASMMRATHVHFMILVHPGTTKEFARIRRHLATSGFSIGYDLLPDDQRAIDLEQGAE